MLALMQDTFTVTGGERGLKGGKEAGEDGQSFLTDSPDCFCVFSIINMKRP